MNETSRLKSQLAVLAGHLQARRHDVLDAWRTTVDEDKNLTSGSGLSRTLFNDHIPRVLDAYERRLLAWPAEVSGALQDQESEGVASHGLHRWQQGFRLRELTREWGHLQLTLVAEIERYALEVPDVTPAAIAAAMRALTQLCVDGVSDSAERYWQMQQADAAGHLRELEQALATVTTLENARAAGWHQAAHDLRGGFTAMEIATTLLKDSDAAPETRDHVQSILERNVSTLHDMLNNLTDLARLQAGQEIRAVAAFDASTLLNDFCLTMQPLATARGLFLRADGPAALPVEGDAVKVRRIVQNLVLNALNYTVEGGVILCWARSEETHAQRWLLTVQDTGPGFAGETALSTTTLLREATQGAHHIQDDAEAGGTSSGHDEHAITLVSQSPPDGRAQPTGEGIGLSIVKGLCDLLDATLELETASGQGSTFRVTLPVQYSS